MYSKQETSILRQQFWTSFGQYLAPIPSAGGNKINWINYNTGARHVHFKMNATDHVYIGIELSHKERDTREIYFTHFNTLKAELEAILGESWVWEKDSGIDDKGLSRIYTVLNNVNIFKHSDWPTIISFLKQRVILLDRFWVEHRDIFEMHG